VTRVPTAPLAERDPRGRAFEFEGRSEAALLIHGFTGTPAELRPVGEMLSRRFGWHVLCPLLPGHGTDLDDLDRTPASAWDRTVAEADAKLRASFSRVHVVGLSMGALLALEQVRANPGAHASLALLAPAVFQKTWFQKVMSRLTLFAPIRRLAPRVKKNPPLLLDHVAYDRYSPPAVAEFTKVCWRARSLQRIEAPPTFLCYADGDEVVDPKTVPFLKDRLEAPALKVLRLAKSSHLVTIDVERGLLLDELKRFYATSPS
jgi:carboxylesterase